MYKVMAESSEILSWSMCFKIRLDDCLEAFRYGSLLFRRFSDGWHITGPAKDLELYADALERDLNV